MRTRLTITAGLLAAGLLALTGCSDDPNAAAGTGGAGDDGTFKVAAFTAGYGTPGGKLTLDKFVEEGKAKGWDVTLYTSDFDYDKINSDMQSAITQGADVILAGFPDPRQIAPLVNAAEGAEIPIFSIDGGVEPNEDFVEDVTFDQDQLAELTVGALERPHGVWPLGEPRAVAESLRKEKTGSLAAPSKAPEGGTPRLGEAGGVA